MIKRFFFYGIDSNGRHTAVEGDVQLPIPIKSNTTPAMPSGHDQTHVGTETTLDPRIFTPLPVEPFHDISESILFPSAVQTLYLSFPK